MRFFIYQFINHSWGVITGAISRFNVDCEASSGLYGLAEGAFGTAGNLGLLSVLPYPVVIGY